LSLCSLVQKIILLNAARVFIEQKTKTIPND
jgi:hypothetical protein